MRFYSVFRTVQQNTKGTQSITQFGRALCELNIEILGVNSSQAKGRVERVKPNTRNRLVKELQLVELQLNA